MKASIPCSHNVFTFDETVFSSNFDNGNLARVDKLEGKNNFRLWTASDNMEVLGPGKHCAHFHFVVCGIAPGSTLRMQVMNVSNHVGLYRHDMRPVYRCQSTNDKWIRIRQPVRFEKGSDVSTLYMEHSVDSPDGKVYFCFTYPYSYETVQNELQAQDELMASSDNGKFFYQRELLTYTPERRRIDLITITSFNSHAMEPRANGKKKKLSSSESGSSDVLREPLFPGLFPDCMGDSTPRPPVFLEKEIFWVSCRVHPGEVPAQHTFKGIFDLLTNPTDAIAIELRKRYVFKLVPMLNPDGVFRGHFRYDQYNQNLNRYYVNPEATAQPAIYAVKQLLDFYSFPPPDYKGAGLLTVYLDLHAHASRRGCFIYGNVMDSMEDQVQNQLYCKLIALNTPNFDYDGCLFSREHMKRIDPGDLAKGLTAEGSGRVATYLAYGLVHSYTLECNYNMNKTSNEVPAMKNEGGLNTSMHSAASSYSTSPEKYTPAGWASVGRACIVAILDIRGHNPHSRIQNSSFKTFDRLKESVLNEVRLRKEYNSQSVIVRRRNQVNRKQLAEAEEFSFKRAVDVSTIIRPSARAAFAPPPPKGPLGGSSGGPSFGSCKVSRFPSNEEKPNNVRKDYPIRSTVIGGNNGFPPRPNSGKSSTVKRSKSNAADEHTTSATRLPVTLLPLGNTSYSLPIGKTLFSSSTGHTAAVDESSSDNTNTDTAVASESRFVSSKKKSVETKNPFPPSGRKKSSAFESNGRKKSAGKVRSSGKSGKPNCVPGVIHYADDAAAKVMDKELLIDQRQVKSTKEEKYSPAKMIDGAPGIVYSHSPSKDNMIEFVSSTSEPSSPVRSNVKVIRVGSTSSSEKKQGNRSVSVSPIRNVGKMAEEFNDMSLTASALKVTARF